MQSNRSLPPSFQKQKRSATPGIPGYQSNRLSPLTGRSSYLSTPKSIKNKDKIYRGTGEALQTYLRENPAVCDQLKIARLRPGGFVATITIGGGKKKNFKPFYMDPHMEYVLYTKYGYEEMACVKPWEQFVTDCKIGRELDPEEAASSAYDA